MDGMGEVWMGCSELWGETGVAAMRRGWVEERMRAI